MLKQIRIEAGLGNPPREYTNNDPEAANFMIKHALKFEAKRPHEFVDDIRNIVETQYRNEDRAVFGKGPYEVRPEFQHLAVDEKQWGSLSHEERKSRLEKYVNSGMDCKKDLSKCKRKDRDDSSNPSTPVISMTASRTGISTMPMSVLQILFDKADKLATTQNNVIPKPGASDGSYVVAGYGNTTHSVTPGKGGSLKCDRSCINASTGICEHVIAVAHVRGSLDDFVQWFKRAKKGPKVMDMALGSGPQNAGKKPSRRKRTNKKKALVIETVDMFADNDNDLSTQGIPSLPVQQQSSSAGVQQPSLSMPLQQPSIFMPCQQPLYSASLRQPSPSMPIQQPSIFMPCQITSSAVPFQQHVPASSIRQAPPYAQQLPNVVWSQQTGATVPSQPLLSVNRTSVASPQLTLHRNDQGTSLPASARLVQQQSFFPPSTVPSQENLFKLKWVTGTTVSRCYGCGRDIENPPHSIPDDLVVVYRDHRQYRERETGQTRFTAEPQNVHFHLRIACIRARYPEFPASALVVPPNFRQHFRQEHVERLNAEFGLTI